MKAPETATKVLLASDDGGASWQHVGSPGPMHWPTIFQCASGEALSRSEHMCRMCLLPVLGTLRRCNCQLLLPCP